MRSARILLFFWVFGLVRPETEAQDFGRRERTFDVEHYRIELSFDRPQAKLNGLVAITLKPLRAGFRTIELDAVDMTIERVFLPSGVDLPFTYDSSALRIDMNRACAYGEELTVTIKYHCTPRRGMYFISPSATFPDDPEQIWTQGQAEDNRHWIPSYDYPNDKATSEVFLTVEDGVETLSNGFLESKKRNDDGTITWHWVMEKPHSSYLIMIAVGRYAVYRDEYDGIPVNSYHYHTDDPADVKRTYNTTAEMVKFFSERIGVRYPWSKYAQISVRHFMYGGMENTTATVMNDTRMVVDARAAMDYSPEGLIAHELAHQWWGDLTTYIDWENGWLNEGFATYFQQLWTQHKRGEDDFATQRTDGINNYLNWTDREGRRPVVGKNAGGANIYSKGAAVLHMLRVMVGEELFWRTIKTFAERFAFKNVETNDFKRTCEDVTGYSLEWFFDQWLYKAGYPDLQVTKTWDAATKTLAMRFRQVQSTDSLCGVFRFPLDVAFIGKSLQRTERVWITNADTTINVSLRLKPDFISVDHGSVLCGRVRVQQPTDELIAHLQLNHDVIKRKTAGAELVQYAADSRVRKALFDAAVRDPHFTVRQRVVNVLADVKPDSIPYRKELGSLFLKLLQDRTASVRAHALNGLSRFRSASFRPEFERMMKDSSYHVTAAAFNCLMGIDSTTTQPVVKSFLASSSAGDLLSMAALDWVAKYRLVALRGEVESLTRPGKRIALRAKAWSVLLEMTSSTDMYVPSLTAILGEPFADARIMAGGLLMKAAPQKGRDILINHLQNEKDKRVVSELKRALGS